MRKKWLIIVSVIVTILVVAWFTVGRQIWMIIFSKGEISGTVGAIPSAADVFTPIEKGLADWPNWRGPDLDGKSSITGIKKDWSGGLQKLWEIDFLCQGKYAASWSAPVVQGNRLIVPGRDEKNDLVFCLDPVNGELIWLKSYEAEAGDSHGPGARATPFIDDDRVYTFGRSGDLACWKLRDGEPVWKMNVNDAGGAEPTWGHSSSPLVYGDQVIVQGGGKTLVIAYDKMTGDLLWKSMEGLAGYAAPTLVNFEEGEKLLIFNGTGLALLQPSNGKELWSIPWKTKYDVNATTPAVAGTAVFITSGYGTGGQALTVGETAAEVVWRNEVIASHHSDPIIIDGFIYGYSGSSSQNRGDFKCVNLNNGEEMWTTGEIGWGTTVYVDGHLLCLNIKGNLFLVKPDPSKFIKVTEFRSALEKVRHPAWTIPVVANGRLYLRYMQRLVCYSLLP